MNENIITDSKKDSLVKWGGKEKYGMASDHAIL